MHVNGATITVVGDFRPVAIRKDIQKRGGVSTRELTSDTNYVVISQSSDSESQIVKEAAKLGIPYMLLDEYRARMPDDLETE